MANAETVHLILLEGDRIYESYINIYINDSLVNDWVTAVVRGDRTMFDGLEYTDITNCTNVRDYFDDEHNTAYGITTSNEEDIDIVRNALECRKLWNSYKN